MKKYAPRGLRYIEPDPKSLNYAKCQTKPCSVCGRVLPDHPDFYGIHAVREYRYRRPECRTCRAKSMRENHASVRIADDIINEGGEK